MKPTALIEELRERGIARSSTALSLEQFEELCAQLGEVRTRRDVRLEAGRGRAFLRAAAVPPHADGDAQLVAWWCKEADPRGGETVLVDTVAVLERLSPERVALLREVSCLLSSMARELYEQPIVHPRGCYWALSGPVDATLSTEAHREAVRALLDAIEAERAEGATRFVLRAGHFHIIDNQRILHSRTAIDPASTRHLVRLWIESELLAPHPYFTRACAAAAPGARPGT